MFRFLASPDNLCTELGGPRSWDLALLYIRPDVGAAQYLMCRYGHKIAGLALPIDLNLVKPPFACDACESGLVCNHILKYKQVVAKPIIIECVYLQTRSIRNGEYNYTRLRSETPLSYIAKLLARYT